MEQSSSMWIGSGWQARSRAYGWIGCGKTRLKAKKLDYENTTRLFMDIQEYFGKKKASNINNEVENKGWNPGSVVA
ncbi:hypothetical protein FRX31_018419 [Thalictrum thalictroides]|uniref:Uncharacterized protein n=1 Tax=Thalictrum thalictroides TaxID=46969 RepID=A0A7J6W6N4_THATH|nr:hypothetical protein FRX31_018419 [Thalictrum thalictroides]